MVLLAYVWWPLAQEYLAYIDWSRPLWAQLDWLLIGIFLFMSLLIMAGADLKKDIWILGVGLAGFDRFRVDVESKYFKCLIV